MQKTLVFFFCFYFEQVVYASNVFIITYSPSCDLEATDQQILQSLTTRHRRLTSKESLKNGNSVPPLNATIIEPVLSAAYHRFKSSRWLKAAGHDRRLFATPTSSDARMAEAAHFTHSRRLSDVTVESRRDRLMALLEVASNINSIMTASDEYKTLDAHYLPKLQIDLIKNEGDVFSIASQLPCLASSPEEDTEKHVEVRPNDLRVRGSSNLAPDAHQWGLLGKDSSPSEPFGANVEKAWDTLTGSNEPGFVVAVVDTGCSMHPDLEANLCTIDDPDCGGYDFGDDDDNPYDEPLAKVHGTPVTSIIAARPNNGFGLAGICWNCRIMCLKVYNSARRAINLSSILRAYDFMITKNVKLSNHSYISFGYSQAEFHALTRLRNAGHLLIVAAGNFACDIDALQPDGTMGCITKDKYLGMAAPAGYPLDNILTVASIDSDGSMSGFSNWGSISVDIFAPGNKVPALMNTVEFGGSVLAAVSGTSFACPHVTGVAALVWGRKPSMKFTDVKEFILSTARAMPSLKGLCVSGGIIDAAAALSAVPGGLRDTPWPPQQSPTFDNTGKAYGGNGSEAKEKRGGANALSVSIVLVFLFCF